MNEYAMDPNYRWDRKPPNEFEINSQFPHGLTSFIIINTTNDVSELYQQLCDYILPFAKYYPWISSKPQIEVKNHTFANKSGVSQLILYIYGELVNFNEIFDEELLLQLLVEFSSRSSCFIHVWNSNEFEVILMHSFEVADDWLLDTTLSMNRCWIHKGKVIVLNNHVELSADTPDTEKFLLLERAVAQIRNNDFKINDPMSKRLNTATDVKYNLPQIYDISIKIDPKLHHIICNNPWTIGRAISGVKMQDIGFLDAENNDDYPPVKVPIHAVRLAEIYIQLMKYKTLDPETVASKIISKGLDTILASATKLEDYGTQEISRDILENVLLQQGKITARVPPKFDTFADAFNDEGLADVQQEVLANEFSSFMDTENIEKILKETDIVEAEESEDELEEEEEENKSQSEVNRMLQDLENSEFADFISYCLENKDDIRTSKRSFLLRDYNDDSEYASDSDLDDLQYLQIDHDEYETYKIVADKEDVLDDDDELISPYDDQEEFQEKINQFIRSKQL